MALMTPIKMIPSFIILAGFLVVAAAGQDRDVSVCTNKTGYFDYEGQQSATRTWTLNGSNCTFDESVLLLILTRIDTFDCEPEITISRFLYGGNICQYSEGTCFLLTSHKSTTHPMLVPGCMDPIWVVSSEVFPITVNFEKSSSRNVYTFNMSYFFVPNEEVTTTAATSAAATVAVDATSGAADATFAATVSTSTPIPQDESTTPEISSNQPKNGTKRPSMSTSQSATNAFPAILFALMTIALMIVSLLARKYHGSMKMEPTQFPGKDKQRHS